MKRVLSLIVAIVMVALMLPAVFVTSAADDAASATKPNLVNIYSSILIDTLLIAINTPLNKYIVYLFYIHFVVILVYRYTVYL